MRRTSHVFVTLVLAGSAAAATAVGTVDVRVAPLEQLTDAGASPWERERNVQALSAHLQALAARLPDGHRLQVEVTDLDLAGRMVPTRHGSEVRLVTGRADWPSVTLRWTLAVADRALAQGGGRIADLSYLTPRRSRDDRPLAYETRLLDRWFDEQIQVAIKP